MDTTPAEIHETIVAALGDRARKCRAEAAGRKWAGPAFAGTRGLLRAEARLCDDLQRIIGHVGPEPLAKVLETEIRADGGRLSR